nr:MAG TPA: RNAseH-like protein [Caudoviricetes sp.]
MITLLPCSIKYLSHRIRKVLSCCRKKVMQNN